MSSWDAFSESIGPMLTRVAVRDTPNGSPPRECPAKEAAWGFKPRYSTMITKLEPFCFWCGGNAQWEFQSPPRPFYPDKQTLCDSCAHMRGMGIIVFELTEQDPGCNNPVMECGKVYYTGRWVVIDDVMAAQVFGPDKLPFVIGSRIAGLRWDNYAKAGFSKYPWRTVQ